MKRTKNMSILLSPSIKRFTSCKQIITFSVMLAAVSGLVHAEELAEGFYSLEQRALALNHLEGDEYVQLRDSLARQSVSLEPSARYTGDAAPAATQDWQRALWTQRVLDQGQFPEAGGVLDQIQGVQPKHYLLRRRGAPEVARELKRLQLPASVLIERFQNKVPHPFAERTAYSVRIDDATFNQLRRQEEEALAVGLLHALGESRAPYVQGFLLSVLVDEDEPVTSRRVALHSLGRLRSERARPEVTRLAVTESTSAELRVPAILALGLYADQDAVFSFNTILSGKPSIQIRRAVLRSANLLMVKAARVQASLEGARMIQEDCVNMLISYAPALSEPGVRNHFVETLSLMNSGDLQRKLGELERNSEPNSQVLNVVQQTKERLSVKMHRASVLGNSAHDE